MGGPVAVYVAFSRDTGSGEGHAGREAELPYWAGLLPSRAGRGRRAKIAVAHREARAPLARGGPQILPRCRGRAAARARGAA